jgi:lipoyl(octanoyl) transferase
VTREAAVRWCGRLSYDDALALQLGLHARRVAGEIPDTLLLLEHHSVYTAGRAADPAHFLVPPDRLQSEGHDVRQAHRGGDVTWHGPGQVVAYPVFALDGERRDVHRYLRLLEDVLIRVASRFGAAARREPGRTGAWCATGKIAAVGIRVSRWVTLHGTAFNVAPDLSRFSAIVPCGIADAPPTSLLRETGAAPDVEEAAAAHADAFAEVFGLEWAHVG